MTGLADTVARNRHPRACSIWFASDATTGDGICDCGLAAESTVEGLYQHDLGAILRALGLGDFARSESPHMVVHDLIIPAIPAPPRGRHPMNDERLRRLRVGELTEAARQALALFDHEVPYVGGERQRAFVNVATRLRAALDRLDSHEKADGPPR